MEAGSIFRLKNGGLWNSPSLRFHGEKKNLDERYGTLADHKGFDTENV